MSHVIEDSFSVVGCGDNPSDAPRGGKHEIQRKGDWIQTYLGVQFFPLDPRVHEIRLLDIAHSLSNTCRFTGHCKSFYSVAQHSVLVSQIVPQEFAAWGLLHDAPEAYMADLSRPIKRHSRLGDEFRSIESFLMAAVCVRFGLIRQEPPAVKYADDIALMTEKRDLMPNSPQKWAETAEPLADRIVCWTPEWAKHQFLKRAGELGLFGEVA